MSPKKDPKVTLEEIVQQQLPPGWTVVQGRMQDTRQASPKGDAALPSLDQLRAKYIGKRARTSSTTAKADTGTKAKTEVVEIQSTGAGQVLKERVGVKSGKVRWKTG